MVITTDKVVVAQYRTTASRVRDLEARLDQLINLQEGFLPTIERMNGRLQAMERRVGNIQSTKQRYEAKADVAELQERLARLELWVESTRRRQTWGPEELAWVRSEYDVLSAGVNGTEGRIDQLVPGRRGSDFSRSGASPKGKVVLPSSSKFHEISNSPSAFAIYDQAATIRVIVEIRVTTDRDGNITAYRVVR